MDFGILGMKLFLNTEITPPLCFVFFVFLKKLLLLLFLRQWNHGVPYARADEA